MRSNHSPDPIGTDYLVARGLMKDTRTPVPYVQSIGRVYRDTRPTAPRGIPMGPVTRGIQFGNRIPTRTVEIVNWPWLIITLAVGFTLGLSAGIGFML